MILVVFYKFVGGHLRLDVSAVLQSLRKSQEGCRPHLVASVEGHLGQILVVFRNCCGIAGKNAGIPHTSELLNLWLAGADWSPAVRRDLLLSLLGLKELKTSSLH